MKPSIAIASRRASVPILLLALPLAGCNEFRAGGADIKVLQTLETQETSFGANLPLIPLTPGNTWDMVAFAQGEQIAQQMVVTGPIVIDGTTGTEIEIRRNGKKWRREVYRQQGNELQLLAAQDENSELMRYVPPIPIARHPAKPGDQYVWFGEFRLKTKDEEIRLPAQGLSRFTTEEKLRAGDNVYRTMRIETLIRIAPGGEVTRFPSARWITPGIGIIRRSYAENNKPAAAEIVRFKVK